MGWALMARSEAMRQIARYVEGHTDEKPSLEALRVALWDMKSVDRLVEWSTGNTSYVETLKVIVQDARERAGEKKT